MSSNRRSRSLEERPHDRRNPTRRGLLIGGAAAIGLGYGLTRVLFSDEERPEPVVDVRALGAAGDGRANDTRAFQRASARIRRAGGGTLLVPAGTYLVGDQAFAGRAGRGYAYRAASVIRISGCPRRVLIEGRGATLTTAPGLRFGAFDPVTGRPYEAPGLPFVNADYRADVYEGALFLADNADVVVRGLLVDGNLTSLIFGGEYGDSGYQVAHDGLVAFDNHRLVIEDCRFVEHGRDGLVIGRRRPSKGWTGPSVRLVSVDADRNGRQGMSWVGGSGLMAIDCSFSHTGRSLAASNPGAGVDIEPEDSTCRDGRFVRCRFIGNRNFGVLAEAGDAADVTFQDCTISAAAPSSTSTTPRAIWPNKPLFRFVGCRIHGSVVRTYGSTNPDAACRFDDCEFSDAPLESGELPEAGLALIEVSGANVSFTRCSVRTTRMRSLALTGGSTPGEDALLNECQIDHRFDGLPAGSYQASLDHVRVDRTVFTEFGLRRPSYIAATNVELVSQVYVSGPKVAWETLAGKTGVIAR